jgi:hypothetical protein
VKVSWEVTHPLSRFGTRLGFSGTPSNILPAQLLPCHFEPGSEAKIIDVLTNPEVASILSLEEDQPTTSEDSEGKEERDNSLRLLKKIATSNYNVLIDTGALITGMSNEEVRTILNFYCILFFFCYFIFGTCFSTIFCVHHNILNFIEFLFLKCEKMLNSTCQKLK